MGVLAPSLYHWLSLAQWMTEPRIRETSSTSYTTTGDNEFNSNMHIYSPNKICREDVACQKIICTKQLHFHVQNVFAHIDNRTLFWAVLQSIILLHIAIIFLHAGEWVCFSWRTWYCSKDNLHCTFLDHFWNYKWNSSGRDFYHIDNMKISTHLAMG